MNKPIRPLHKNHAASRPWRQICLAGIGATCAIGLPAGTFAALFYWTGDHDANWSTTTAPAGTNWSSSPDFNADPNGVPGAADSAVFAVPNAVNLNTVLGADFSIKSLAFTGDLLPATPVTIGGTNTLTLGTGGMTSNTNAPVTLSTKVALGGSQIWANGSIAQPLTVGGVISGGFGNNLTLSGPGAFTFTGANTYTGSTTLSAGTTLTLSGPSGSLLGSLGITLAGGTLTLDNTAGASNTRLINSAIVTSSGGTLNLLGASGSTPSNQTVGTLVLGSGATSVNVLQSIGNTAALTFGSASVASISRPITPGSAGKAASPGGTVNFSPNATGSIFLPNVGLANGIIGGWATIGAIDNSGALDFATVNGSGKVIPLAAYAGTLTAGATANVQLAAPAAMGGNQSINSLYLTGSGAVTFASGNTLTIGSGGIISNGATGTIAAGNNQPAITNVATLGATDSANTGAITTASGGDLIITTSSNLQINALLTGNVALTKSGAGLLDLSHQNAAVPIANSYTGITTINAGVIKVNSDSNLGAAPGTFTANALTLNGGELRVATAFALASNRGITVGPQGGTLSYTDGSVWTLSQAITGAGGVTIFADPASNTTAGADSIILLANASPSPVNDYQGATLLKTSAHSAGAGRGVIQWGADNQIPDGSAVTVSGDAGTVIDLNGHNDTFGSLAGSTNIQGLTGSLKVGGNNQSTTYSGVLGAAPIGITAGSGQTSSTASTGSVEKTGSGTWTLTGTNAYTGATTISGGTLLIGSGTATTSSASLASATVNVNTGALGGNGTIAGAVSVGAAGQLAPAMSSTTTNTLTIGSNLTISGSTLNFNFGAAPASIGLGAVGTSDLILLPGATSVLTIGGTVTLNISAVSPGFGVGAYKLIDASANSAMFANTATFTIRGATNFTYTIVSSGGALDPAVGGGTVPLGDLYLQVLQGSPTLTWTGNTNANWDTVSANWTSASAGNIYANGSNAVFDDTAGGSSNIAVDGGGVSPSSIIFNNATRSYIFGGGAITVTSASGITKNQAGTVTFNTNVTTPVTTIANGSVIVSAGQTYTSSTAVNINGGSLSVSGTLNTPTLNDATNGALFVSQTGSLNNNIALTVNGTATFNNAAQTIGGITGTGTVILNGTTLGFVSDNAFAGTITGTGGITVAGGNVTLSNGGNTYNGATTISGGTLRVTNTTGSATGTSAVTVQNGGTLAGAGIITGPVNINAGGILQSNGTLSGSVTLGGTFSPAGDGTVGKITLGSLLVNDGAAFNFDLAAIGASDNGTLTGALTLLGAETLKLNLLAGTMVGDYPLFTAAGGITDNATFTIQPSGAGNVAGATYTVLKVGNQLVLRLGVPTITWTGATSNNWDFVDANWTTNPYSDASQVTFNDSGANTTININAPVAPLGGLLFSNSLINYTLAGKPIGGGGGLTLNGSGTVTIGAGNTFTGASAINAGTLSIAADSSLGAAPAAPMPAALTIAAGATLAVTPGSASFVLNGNRGLAVGGASGSGATISVPTGTTLTYTGAIANITGQQGILTKSGAGELDLAGTSTFSGGLNVNGGAVRLSGATSAGTGAISVSNATLDLGAGVSNPTITLGAGSTLGVFGGAQTYGGNLLVTGAATVDAFDPITAATPLDVILTGMLQGSGNVTIGNQNSTTPDGAGVQLHGPPSAGINAYSGNIIVLNSSKLELQTAAASGSVAGNGTIVLNVGATDPLTNAGTFSLLNLRNNFAGNTSFGNNVQLTGSNGAAYLNLVGTAPAGSTVNMGNLSIGDTQALGAVSATATLPYTVAFSSVTLTGGNATFTPQPVGNTTYVAAESIRLGPISENAPGSGITMNGAATLTLAAANHYSGATKILSGTVIAAVPSALPAASALIVNGGKLDLNNGLSSNDQTVASLAGTNGTITNSDATNPHTLTVNQASAGGPTSFSGSISGNLALTKSGNGTLQLLGVESPALGTTVNGGTLSIQATLNGAATVGGTGTLNVGSDALHGTVNGAITVASGGTLNGFGTTRAVTVQGGGFLSPGNAAGIMTINGNLDLSAPTSHLTLQLGGTVVSPNPTYDLLEQSSGTIKLGGDVGISFINSGSFTPAIGDTFYVIVNLPGQAVSGAFANDLGGVITDTAGDTFAVSYSANFFNPANSTTDGAAGFAPGQGHDVALQVLTVIPEPGSLATALSGFGVLLGLGRFRRRR